MVFGFFKKKKNEDLVKLNNNVNALRLPLVFKHLEDKFDIAVGYCREVKEELESYKKQIECLEKQIKNIEGVKEPKEIKTKIKISTTQAILNILESNRNPLDFNYIFDNIKKYDLKQKNPSPKLVKRSIYNLVYNGKVVCGDKRGTYQICATPTKH